jgi:hypothetical protein
MDRKQSLKIIFATETDQSRFIRRLRLLSEDIERYGRAAAPFVAIHERAGEDDLVRALNKDATFWNCTLAALQSCAFVSVGRIHDAGKSGVLRPLLKTLDEAASKECRGASAALAAAISRQQTFIDAVLHLRHTIFAHTSYDAPVHATKG